MMLPSAYPVTPPRNENQPTLELFSPIAWSRPCTGYGVNTSHFLNPASRTFSAACIVPDGVSNSAIRPYGFPVSGIRALLPGFWAENAYLEDWLALLRQRPVHNGKHPTPNIQRPTSNVGVGPVPQSGVGCWM